MQVYGNCTPFISFLYRWNFATAKYIVVLHSLQVIVFILMVDYIFKQLDRAGK